MLPAPFAIGLKRPATDRNTIERLHSPTAKTHSFPLPARVLTVSRSAPTRVYDSVFGIRRAVRSVAWITFAHVTDTSKEWW